VTQRADPSVSMVEVINGVEVGSHPWGNKVHRMSFLPKDELGSGARKLAPRIPLGEGDTIANQVRTTAETSE